MALKSAGKAFQTVAVRKRNDLPACFPTRGRVNASRRRRLRVGQYPAASKSSGWVVTKWKNSIRQAIFLRQDRLGHPSCLNNDDLGSSDGQGHLSSRMTVRATLACSRSRVSRCAAEREDSHTGAVYSAVGRTYVRYSFLTMSPVKRSAIWHRRMQRCLNLLIVCSICSWNTRVARPLGVFDCVHAPLCYAHCLAISPLRNDIICTTNTRQSHRDLGMVVWGVEQCIADPSVLTCITHTFHIWQCAMGMTSCLTSHWHCCEACDPRLGA